MKTLRRPPLCLRDSRYRIFFPSIQSVQTDIFFVFVVSHYCGVTRTTRSVVVGSACRFGGETLGYRRDILVCRMKWTYESNVLKRIEKRLKYATDEGTNAYIGWPLGRPVHTWRGLLLYLLGGLFYSRREVHWHLHSYRRAIDLVRKLDKNAMIIFNECSATQGTRVSNSPGEALLLLSA